MRVRFHPDARGDIAAIHSHIHGRNPIAATRVVRRIHDAAARLGEFPRLGRVGRDPGTYEWPVHGLPYIIVYEVKADEGEIVILAVFHGAQDR